MSPPLLLLVDDSAEMGLIVSSLGKRAGCEVLVSVDAESAWQTLAQRRPDLVLLDINLPGVNGAQWLRWVRAAPEFARLPIALYTHWGLTNDVVAGLEAGADFVFDKDLAARPTDWLKRLAEIRASASGVRCYGNVTANWSTVKHPPTIIEREAGRLLIGSQIAGLNDVLRHALLRRVPSEVIRVLLQQALGWTFIPPNRPSDLEHWIASDGCGLEQERLPPLVQPDSLLYLSANLVEQMGRLLGAEANSALRNALIKAVPGLPEFLAGS